MVKLKDGEISKTDISKFIKNESDFSFEMSVVSALYNIGYETEHSGTYEDPVTGKTRQFDIRACFLYGDDYILSLAVECKNIKNHFPIVTSSVKRDSNESYAKIITSNREDHKFQCRPKTDNILGSFYYRIGEYVVKNIDQVGRNLKGELISNDGETFDKVSQAINSSLDLIKRASHRSLKGKFEFVCPVLVIPDGMLWNVEYSDDGTQVSEPQQIQRCSYFIDKEWEIRDDEIRKFKYKISHLEIVTFSELKNFTQAITNYRTGVFRGNQQH